jgi:hypothetical protein
MPHSVFQSLYFESPAGASAAQVKHTAQLSIALPRIIEQPYAGIIDVFKLIIA